MEDLGTILLGVIIIVIVAYLLYFREQKMDDEESDVDDDLDDEGNTVFYFDLDYPRSWVIRKCEIYSPVNLWFPPKGPNKFCIVYQGAPGEHGPQMGVVPKGVLYRFDDPLGFEYSAEVVNIGPSAKSCTIRCKIYNKAVTHAKWQEEKKQKAEKLKPLLSKPYRPKKNITITVDANKDKVELFKRGLKLYLKEKTLEEYLEEPDHLALIFCDDKGEEIAEKRIGAAHVMSIIRAQLSGHDIDFEVTWGYKVQVTYHLK